MSCRCVFEKDTWSPWNHLNILLVIHYSCFLLSFGSWWWAAIMLVGYFSTTRLQGHFLCLFFMIASLMMIIVWLEVVKFELGNLSANPTSLDDNWGTSAVKVGSSSSSTILRFGLISVIVTGNRASLGAVTRPHSNSIVLWLSRFVEIRGLPELLNLMNPLG